MRVLGFSVLLLILAASLAEGQRGRPIPPGIREGDKIANQPLPPPIPLKIRRATPEQLKVDAAELERLAGLLPGQIDQVAKGELPKDLNENLKRIEKLAKHLRSEITP